MTGPARHGALRSRSDVEDVHPLSPFQDWALRTWLTDPAPGRFLLQRLEVTLLAGQDEAQLATALGRAVEAHPVLRTTFSWAGLDEPVQVVHRRAPLGLVVEDWSADTDDEQDARLRAYLAADRDRGCDPTSFSGLRYLVARIDRGAALVVLSLSYLCLDGRSFDLVAEEMLRTLRSLATGRPDEPPPPRPSFRAHVDAARAPLAEAARLHWREHLAGLPEPTSLRRHLGSPGAGRPGRERQALRLDAALAAGAREHTALDALWHTAWALAVAAVTGSADPVHGVLLPTGPAGVVGPACALLPVRARLLDTEPVSAVVARVGAALAAARAHSGASLDAVLRCAGPPGAAAPFEDYLVVHGANGVDGAERVGESLQFADTGLPLRLDVFPSGTVCLSYRSEVFPTRGITRLLGGFAAALTALTADPAVPVGRVLAALRTAAPAPDVLVQHEDDLRVSALRGMRGAGR